MERAEAGARLTTLWQPYQEFPICFCPVGGSFVPSRGDSRSDRPSKRCTRFNIALALRNNMEVSVGKRAKLCRVALLILVCLCGAPVRGQESVDQGGRVGGQNSPAADFRRESPAAPFSANSPESSRPGLVPVAFRSGRGGLLAHHWIEVQTSRGSFTLGFGPALIPFIDRGQITVEDRYGHIEWRYLLHPLSLHWNFARAPGIGRNIGNVIYLPISRADALVDKQRHRRPILPYIPFFHDCRTYVCTIQASTQGKSTLPCYLLLKGYW